MVFAFDAEMACERGALGRLELRLLCESVQCTY
jgi:hypothetical protein